MLQVFDVEEWHFFEASDNPEFDPNCRGLVVEANGRADWQLCNTFGFNCIRYYFNICSFDAGVDSVHTAWVLINPYLVVESLPLPPIPESKRGPLRLIEGMEEPPISHCWDLERCPLTADDLLVWEHLPNGWSTTSLTERNSLGVEDLSYSWHRPSSGFPVYGHHIDSLLASDVLLHPTKPRPMTQHEIDATQQHTFNVWVEQMLDGLAVHDVCPIGNWQIAYDITVTHRTNKLREIIAPTFRWQDGVEKVKRIKEFLKGTGNVATV